MISTSIHLGISKPQSPIANVIDFVQISWKKFLVWKDNFLEFVRARTSLLRESEKNDYREDLL